MSYLLIPLRFKLLIVIVLSLWLAWQSSYVYDSYKIRQRVTDSLKMANSAKTAVEDNAIKGIALDTGWVPQPTIDGVQVNIAQNTGVITLTYGANVDVAGRTLTMVPVLSGITGEYAFSGNENSSSLLIPASQISWVCASADTMARNPTVLQYKGTLPTKYAPLECRW